MTAPVRIAVPLARPVTVAGERHDTISLRAPRRCDHREAGKACGGFPRGVELVARMSGVPAVVILALDDEDRERVGAVARSILDVIDGAPR